MMVSGFAGGLYTARTRALRVCIGLGPVEVAEGGPNADTEILVSKARTNLQETLGANTLP